MKIQQIAAGTYLLPLSNVNAYLQKSKEGLVLIDTGVPGSAPQILEAIRSIGYQPADLKTILLTHCHADHVGSAAALKRDVPDVKIYISELEAPIVEKGLNMRPMKPAPGLLNKLLFRLFIKEVSIEAVNIDGTFKDDEILDFAGGMKAIHVPGHSLGQYAFLSPNERGILFAADVASNVLGLGWSIGHEDFDTAKQSLAKLSRMDFNIACFGHGKPCLTNASEKFRKEWA
jgi:glyoxylase-like metal-dependent hydrolase (beta-lactamase superfamily II)